MFWFKKKANREDVEKSFRKVRSDFSDIKKENKALKEELNLKTSKKEVELMIKENTLSLEERLLNKEEITKPIPRLNTSIKRLNTTKQPPKRLDEDLSIGDLTPKEQEILKVMLNHRDMALSYEDIGKELGKSPNTIKCQLNSIRNKTDIFNESTDKENKHRYKIKSGLSINKSFDV